MDIIKYINKEWESLISLLPRDLDKSAFAYGALYRKRGIKSAPDLLRVVLAYSWSKCSLRDTAAWAQEAGIADVSDVALLSRLKNSAEWMGALVTGYLKDRTKLNLTSTRGLRIRIGDATSITRPGSKGTDFKLHMTFDLEHLCCDHLVLTGPEGAESLKQLGPQPGDVIIGDRAYGNRKGIFAAVSAGAQVIVRLAIGNMPLMDKDGRHLDVLDELEYLQPGEIADIDVSTAPMVKEQIPSIPGRLIARRKSRDDAERSRQALIKQHKKKGKMPASGALRACEYIILFTTLGHWIPAVDVLELYRFRWQIEIAFKRMKSLLHLDEMAAKNDDLCRTFIFGKLLALLLIEDLIEQMGSFPPCGGESTQRQPSLAPV